MKSISFTVCVFTNLILIGMGGYFYLLLTQYWSIWNKNGHSLNSRSTIYDKEIYYYNRGYPNDSSNEGSLQSVSQQPTTTAHHKRISRQTSKKKINERKVKGDIIVKAGQPRFPNLDRSILEEIDTSLYKCSDPEDNVCIEKTQIFKERILMELRRMNIKSSKWTGNRYHLQYSGPREDFTKKTTNELICEMKEQLKNMHTITKHDQIFENERDNEKYFPDVGIFQQRYFNSCAVVSSAGALLNSNLGSFIDSHDLILRFNHAPTTQYEPDVGKSTSMRVVNSQVVAKPHFNFTKSQLYNAKNLTLLVWDPKRQNDTIPEWLNQRKEFFENFRAYKDEHSNAILHLLHPESLWDIWRFLQRNSLSQLPKTTPSSGFIGVAFLMEHCSFVDVFEYVPSTRITKQCYYFEPGHDLECTLGGWHPKAAEKLIAYGMNVADDFTVFQSGYIRLPGYATVKC